MANVETNEYDWPTDPTPRPTHNVTPENEVVPLAPETSHSAQTVCLQGLTAVSGSRVHYTLEMPNNPVDTLPAIIVPGFGGIKPAYKPLRQALAQMGKPAVSYRPPRVQDAYHSLHPMHILHPEQLPSMATWAVMKDIHNRYGLDKFDLIGHSMGGFTAALTAQHKANRVRSLTLMASAGLNGHTPFSLSRRVPKFVRHELLPAIGKINLEDNWQAARHVLDYVFSNPLRTVAEGMAVAHCDIRPVVNNLGKVGVKRAVLLFPADEFFPLEEVQSNAQHLVDILEVYGHERGKHITPQLEPECVGRTILNIISRLQDLQPAAA